jgi:hypothetical protein
MIFPIYLWYWKSLSNKMNEVYNFVMFYMLIRVMTLVQESDPDMYPYFAFLISWGQFDQIFHVIGFLSHMHVWWAILLFFWDTITFYKPGWQTYYKLHIYILLYHLRYLYLLNLLIVYRVTFLVRLNWLIDWLVYKTDKLIKHIKYYKNVQG